MFAEVPKVWRMNVIDRRRKIHLQKAEKMEKEEKEKPKGGKGDKGKPLIKPVGEVPEANGTERELRKNDSDPKEPEPEQ